MLVVLALLPLMSDSIRSQLLTYGLIASIAALGFNLLLGYTGLLSFGHSAFFGIGAYTVAFLLRDAGIHSMELYILIGLPIAALSICLVRLHLRAPYANLLRHSDTGAVAGALQPGAQAVLGHRRHRWSARARGPRFSPGCSTSPARAHTSASSTAYYYYVLVMFAVCVVIMWVIVHSPFGKALQAIRDNETRAAFLGIAHSPLPLDRFRISGHLHGLAGILWVPLNGLTTPEMLYWPFSGEIVFTACSAVSATSPDRSSAASCSPISRPMRSRRRNTGSSARCRAGRCW